MYSLQRADGLRVSGDMSVAVRLERVEEPDARPRVSVRMRAGSAGPWRDRLLTGVITRILVDSPRCVEFETESGSTWAWGHPP